MKSIEAKSLKSNSLSALYDDVLKLLNFTHMVRLIKRARFCNCLRILTEWRCKLSCARTSRVSGTRRNSTPPGSDYTSDQPAAGKNRTFSWYSYLRRHHFSFANFYFTVFLSKFTKTERNHNTRFSADWKTRRTEAKVRPLALFVEPKVKRFGLRRAERRRSLKSSRYLSRRPCYCFRNVYHKNCYSIWFSVEERSQSFDNFKLIFQFFFASGPGANSARTIFNAQRLSSRKQFKTKLW